MNACPGTFDLLKEMFGGYSSIFIKKEVKICSGARKAEAAAPVRYKRLNLLRIQMSYEWYRR